MSIIARHLTISGKVQGVWYRGWTVKSAQALGLTGWVRNRLNGDVEAFIQGEVSAVTALIEKARSGPPAAIVTALTAQEVSPDPEMRDFSQHPTA